MLTNKASTYFDDSAGENNFGHINLTEINPPGSIYLAVVLPNILIC